MATSDLMAVFGEALAPLIEASIRVMYLGVMGWIGSILTMRGAQLLTSLKGGFKINWLRASRGLVFRQT